MSDAEPCPDPVFDTGMTAHGNRLPRSANPHPPGTTARADWDRGWTAAESRNIEISGDGALL